MTDNTRQITDPGAVRDFILGGKATFTIVSKKTTTRFTYKVELAEGRDDFFFVSYLTGPDNWANYTYLGFISNPIFNPRLIAGSKGKPHIVAFQALDWLLYNTLRPAAGKLDMLEFWHEGKCCRCNRKLTVPSSIESGVGPECARKLAAV